MDAGFLERLLGGDRVWTGPCVVILDTDASVKTPGPDSIATGGMKSYAPRVSSGRLTGDTTCLLREEKVLLVIEQAQHRDAVGNSFVKQSLTVVDCQHVAAIEFDHVHALKALGISQPPPVRETEYRPGMLVG